MLVIGFDIESFSYSFLISDVRCDIQLIGQISLHCLLIKFTNYFNSDSFAFLNAITEHTVHFMYLKYRKCYDIIMQVRFSVIKACGKYKPEWSLDQNSATRKLYHRWPAWPENHGLLLSFFLSVYNMYMYLLYVIMLSLHLPTCRHGHWAIHCAKYFR